MHLYSYILNACIFNAERFFKCTSLLTSGSAILGSFTRSRCRRSANGPCMAQPWGRKMQPCRTEPGHFAVPPPLHTSHREPGLGQLSRTQPDPDTPPQRLTFIPQSTLICRALFCAISIFERLNYFRRTHFSITCTYEITGQLPIFLCIFQGSACTVDPPQQDRTSSLPSSRTLRHFTPTHFSSSSMPSRKHRTDAAEGLSSPQQWHEVFSAQESARLRQVSITVYDCCSMTRYNKAREYRTF